MNIAARVLTLAVSSVVFAGDTVARTLTGLFGRRSRGTCVVVYYHVVSANEEGRFEWQMEMVSKAATAVALDPDPVPQPGIRYVAVTFDDAFQPTLQRVLPILRARAIPVGVFVPSGCLGRHAPWIGPGDDPAEGEVVVSEDELGELGAEAGVTIGSHGVGHRWMPSLDDAGARHEIRESKQSLDLILKRPVTLFCFPYGAYGSREVELARFAGYRRVFSTEPVNGFRSDSEFVTGRVRVDPSDWRLEFFLKIMGAYRWRAAASALKRRMASRPVHGKGMR